MLCIVIPEVITDVMSSELTDFALNIYLSVQTNKQMTNGMTVARPAHENPATPSISFKCLVV